MLNEHRVLLNRGEFFLMLSMVYFGHYCCQEELQWGWKVYRQMQGILHQHFAYLLQHLLQTWLLRARFLQFGSTEQHQQLFGES